MSALYLASVWLHVLAAAVWIGGMVFLAAVLVPALRRPDLAAGRAALIHDTGLRFLRLGWACLAALAATGVFNLGQRAVAWSDVADPRFWQSGFGRVLGLKLGLVATILALSALHDFVLGPRATALLREAPESPGAAHARRRASRLGRANLLLGLAALALGIVLARGAAQP
jgi:putative copper resistance protein D